MPVLCFVRGFFLSGHVFVRFLCSFVPSFLPLLDATVIHFGIMDPSECEVSVNVPVDESGFQAFASHFQTKVTRNPKDKIH